MRAASSVGGLNICGLHYTELNQIYYWFWGHVDILASKKQLKTLVELKIMVEEYAATFE